MVESGNYYLIDENITTKERMYMDFEGRKDFKPVEYTTRYNVPLPLIDVLTCSYQDEATFRAYLDKGANYEDNKEYMMFIAYRNNGEKKLSCIYNDETLQHIASKTIGLKRGQVNMSDDVTRRVMYGMYQEVITKSSSFTEQVLRKTKNSYLINSHNKEMISALHCNQPYTVRSAQYQFGDFAKHFGTYKEFRALYASYREFIKKEKAFEKQASDEVVYDTPDRQLKKTNRPLPNQMNINDLLANK